MVNTGKYLDMYSGKDKEFMQDLQIVFDWSRLIDYEESLKTKDPETGEERVKVEYSPLNVVRMTKYVHDIFMKYAAKGMDSPYAGFVRNIRKALDEAYSKVESSYKILRKRNDEEKEQRQKEIEEAKKAIKEADERKNGFRDFIGKKEEEIKLISTGQTEMDSMISDLYK